MWECLDCLATFPNRESAHRHGDDTGHTVQGEPRVIYGESLKTASIKLVSQAAMRACPFAIMAHEHYREDGSCKCNDAEHREFMKREWEYTDEDFRTHGLIP